MCLDKASLKAFVEYVLCITILLGLVENWSQQNKKSFNSESSLLMFRLRFGADVVLFFKMINLILFFYI
jgi:hypothetical protein